MVGKIGLYFVAPKIQKSHTLITVMNSNSCCGVLKNNQISLKLCKCVLVVPLMKLETPLTEMSMVM